MVRQTFSEMIFERLCSTHSVPCERIATGSMRTPDFAIQLAGTRVVCEVKQIDPNAEDLREAQAVDSGETSGRYVPNRLRGKLKNVSGQLKAAAAAGCPTMLVLYDNTPFKMYSLHFDVVQSMFGGHSVAVRAGENGEAIVSDPFFGGNRGLTPRQNTSIGALVILDGGPLSQHSLRVYHNPYASVVLRPELLAGLPVAHCVLPGARAVRL